MNVSRTRDRLLAGCIVAIMALIWFAARQSWEVKKLQLFADQHNALHRTISGDGELFGRYHVVTLDGGRNWYNMEQISIAPLQFEVKITGPADDKLARYLQAWDSLPGRELPLDPAQVKDADLLRDLGFEVIINEKEE